MLKKINVKTRRILRDAKIKISLYRNLHTKPKSTMYLSARLTAYEKFGRDFFDRIKPTVFHGGNGRKYFFEKTNPSYESKFVLGISIQKRGQFNLQLLSKLSLGFEKKALIIEGMQNNSATRNNLNEFRRLTKNQTLDFMLKKTEERAKQLGFKEIKIRNPQYTYWYQNPILIKNKTKKQIQRQIRILYQKIALKHGYTIQGKYYVKELK